MIGNEDNNWTTTAAAADGTTPICDCPINQYMLSFDSSTGSTSVIQ